MASRPLCFLLLLLVASTVLARPNDAEGPLSPTLDITSSVQLGHPLLGDTLGPFPTGIDVQLICSSRDGSLVLSWWEGVEELDPQEVNIGDQGIAISISLETLSVSDSGRRLTCKAEETEVEKTVSIQVEKTDAVQMEESDSTEIEESASLEETETLDIHVDGQSLQEDQDSINVKSGDALKLTCVLRGYNTPILSWLEDGVQLEALFGKSSYAVSSVLTVSAVSAADSGRRFSCRSEDGSQERVVEILVYDDNALETLQIFLICICVVGILLIVVMATVVARLVRDYKEAVRCQQVSKVSDIFRKYSRLPNINGSSQDAFVPQLARGPYKPCTVLLDPEGNEY